MQQFIGYMEGALNSGAGLARRLAVRDGVAQAQRVPKKAEVAVPPRPAVEAPRAPTPAAEAPKPKGDDPYIETPKCATCEECVKINDRMFKYDANKQAYIADPDAGTYRELVEAAESCQVSIIHPGKPRNPQEPGRDELLKRAEPFL